jgi:hypothetical protein
MKKFSFNGIEETYLKFSAVLGTTSAYNSKVTLPAGFPEMSMSKNTTGFFISIEDFEYAREEDFCKNDRNAKEDIAIEINKIRTVCIYLFSQLLDQQNSVLIFVKKFFLFFLCQIILIPTLH